jgi:hypothetical protein
MAVLTMRKKPMESRKASALWPPSAVTTLKLGVRMRPKEIQKPPYDDSAVAPKVLPTAISLP